MTSFTIYLGGNPIANTSGADYTATVFAKACALAELLNKTVDLTSSETGEVFCTFDPEADYEVEEPEKPYALSF